MGDLILTASSELLSPGLLPRENREFASEIKYLIPGELAPRIRQWARGHLAADPYGGGAHGDSYETSSLYFDTRAFDVLHRSGSFGRSKYRIRRYGQAPTAFVERKLKTGNLVSKRRSMIAIPELEKLNTTYAGRGWAGYWFHRRIAARALAPVCQISYVRMARMANSSLGPIRLTLDQDLHAIPISRVAYDECGSKPLAPNHLILELKYRYAMPELFQRFVDTFQLQSQPVSKYRLAASIPGCVAGLEPSK